MEGQPRNHGDLPADEAARAAEFQRLVHEGIERSQQEDRPIDDLTAKRIAQALSPGWGSLHELAETGAIEETIEFDLAMAEEVAQDLAIEDLHVPWIAALRTYLGGRLLRSALPGWRELGTEQEGG
jgi:hypothetical protein